jgi:CDP-diacylglycerol--glycerol-3-phosphate 3-phosphatidyltransferase
MEKQRQANFLTGEPLVRPGIIPNVPNALSLMRLLATPALVALVIAGHERPFRWLLVVSLLSDIIDGLLARALKITSKFGALLDSAADLLLSFTAAFAIIRLRFDFFSNHYASFLVIIGLYSLSLAAGIVRYGRMASFHTLGCRIAAYVQGIFIVILFFHEYEPGLFYFMIVVSALAYLEELALVCLLANWTPNVGGLHRVLKNGRS